MTAQPFLARPFLNDRLLVTGAGGQLGRRVVELKQLYLMATHQGVGVAQQLMDWSIAEAEAQLARIGLAERVRAQFEAETLPRHLLALTGGDARLDAAARRALRLRAGRGDKAG